LLTLDGATGEGGGQILRTALTLALVTGTPFRIERIRANRPQPGLQRQHLASVEAAMRVSGARVGGAALGATAMSFEPGPLKPGNYSFSIATAGSATLVLQTILPALMLGSSPSRLALEGGTHNPWAPPYDFLAQAFLPLVQRMGPRLETRLQRWGFYPAGGGRFELDVDPVARLTPLTLLERGRLKACRVRGVAGGLPRSLAARAVEAAFGALGLTGAYVDVREVPSAGPGHALLVELIFDNVCEVVSGFGQKGVKPEDMGAQAARQAREYLDADVPVGPHLADQLVLPLALCGSGSFLTMPPTRHLTTNIEVVRCFLDVDLRCEAKGSGRWLVSAG